MRRDIRISVRKENRDIFAICAILKKKGYSPSNFICIATREKFERDVKLKVLSPRQQEARPVRQVVITPTREKTQDEIRYENEQAGAQLIRDEEKRRVKAEEIERIKKIMRS